MSDHEGVSGEFRLTSHPGAVINHYVHNSLLPAQHYFDNVPNLDQLIAGKIPFDENFESIFKFYMGKQATLLFRMQKTYDYEQKTGIPYSGSGPIPSVS